MIKVNVAAEQPATQIDHRLGIDSTRTTRRPERRFGQAGAGIHVASAADNQRAAVRAGPGIPQPQFVAAGRE
ncbi:hypothetical protein D3C71_1436140 [compost metagenome]